MFSGRAGELSVDLSCTTFICAAVQFDTFVLSLTLCLLFLDQHRTLNPVLNSCAMLAVLLYVFVTLVNFSAYNARGYIVLPSLTSTTPAHAHEASP